MNNKSRNEIVSLLIMIVLTCLIVFTINFYSNNQNNSSTIEELKNIFESNGYTFSAESADDDILEGERYYTMLNDGNNIQIYVYDSAKKAKADSECISSDGCGYSNGGTEITISWIDVPYFYLYENVIILYVGDDEELIDFLANTFGEKFAGG